jgi:hypothetical protein
MCRKTGVFKNDMDLNIQKTNVISLTDFGLSWWLVIDIISFISKTNSIHFNYNIGDVLVLNCVKYLHVKQHVNHASS